MEAMTPNWSFARKQLFRFWCSYLSLYILALFILGNLFVVQVTAVGRLMGITTPMDSNGYGSGDTIFQYVLVVCILATALLASIVWAVIDRKRKNYDKAQYWFLMVFRYILAYFMIVYGFGKMEQNGQFPAPYLSRLLQPYGDSSPMGLAWTFMGASKGYSSFAGLAEAVGGILLLFRRTTMFGALVCITVMSNVVAMNFFYDIPVKLFSAHLLLMAVVIVAPDIPRLFNFFFRNKAVSSAHFYPVLTAKWERFTYIGLKLLVLYLFIVPCIKEIIIPDTEYNSPASAAPLYGIYDVKTFVKGNDTLLPLITDNYRWRRFVVNNEVRAMVYKMNDSSMRYDIEVDEKEHIITLQTDTDSFEMQYTRLADSTLLVAGELSGEPVKMIWQPVDTKRFLLTSRGFHWVNARPFNR
jgi:uncharacterized membrane protein YphA (DoxX/SURF4 family)